MRFLCAKCGEETRAGARCSACGEEPLLEGRYRLDELIGQGASGLTYRATRLSDDHVVAVKELSYRAMQSFEMEKLFRREADILKQLDHPGIPAYIDDFTLRSGKHLSLYLVQEFVDGQSLAAEMDSRRYTEAEVVEILAAVADILVYLQDLRPPVFHRDIKPANVMRTEDGRLVLVDFGSVKATTDGAVGGSTVAGTFGYMAPEQHWGQASRQTDLYGLGALGLALLSRRDPTELVGADHRLEWRRAVDVSAPIERLLGSLLAHKASDRPEDARAARREIAAAVEPAVDEPTTPPQTTAPEPKPQPKPQRSRRDASTVRLTPLEPDDSEDSLTSEGERKGAGLGAAVMVMGVAVVLMAAVGVVLTTSKDPTSGPSAVATSEPQPASAAFVELESVACKPSECKPLRVPFKEGLRFGMTLAQAKAARPELEEARVEEHGSVTVRSDGVRLATVEAPGPVVHAQMAVMKKPARCELAFFDGGGLSKISCEVDALASLDGTEAYARAVARRLSERYGVPAEVSGLQTERMAAGFPNLDGGWEWRSDEATLTLSAKYNGLLAGALGAAPGDNQPGPVSNMAATVELEQTSQAHRQELRARARRKATRDEERARKRREREREEIERLEKLSEDDPL